MNQTFMKNEIEVTRSFSQKVKIGEYLTANFFAEAKALVPEEKAEEKSEELYAFCSKEVEKSIKSYQGVDKDEANKLWKGKVDELYGKSTPQENYNERSKAETIVEEIIPIKSS